MLDIVELGFGIAHERCSSLHAWFDDSDGSRAISGDKSDKCAPLRPQQLFVLSRSPIVLSTDFANNALKIDRLIVRKLFGEPADAALTDLYCRLPLEYG